MSGGPLLSSATADGFDLPTFIGKLDVRDIALTAEAPDFYADL